MHGQDGPTRLIQAMAGHPALVDHELMRTARDQTGAGRTDTSSSREAMLMDELLDVYIHWRESARAVPDAYAQWSFAPAPERVMRFAGYIATLDQEQKSAAGYAEAVVDLGRCVQRSHPDNLGIDAARTPS